MTKSDQGRFGLNERGDTFLNSREGKTLVTGEGNSLFLWHQLKSKPGNNYQNIRWLNQDRHCK